jgi:hypothetical protein
MPAKAHLIPTERPVVWQTMDNAPKNGRWFLVLRSVTAIGVSKEARAVPDLYILRCARSSPESDGYWQSSWGHSVSDDYVSGGMWAELDALPLREMYKKAEDKRRAFCAAHGMEFKAHGPVPFDD